jgi:hypothetical protein
MEYTLSPIKKVVNIAIRRGLKIFTDTPLVLINYFTGISKNPTVVAIRRCDQKILLTNLICASARRIFCLRLVWLRHLNF